MDNNNDKNKDFENPVGSDAPMVKFEMPLWQVFVTLFLIALVLTAFKLYERHFIAPEKEVKWKLLDLTEFRQERLHRRNILVWVHSPNADLNQGLAKLFDEPSVRVAAYLNRCLAYKVDRLGDAEPLDEWISKNLAEIAEGGLAFWMASEKKPEMVKLDELDSDSLVGLIEGR